MNVIYRGLLDKEAEEGRLIAHNQETFEQEAKVGELLTVPFIVGTSPDFGARLHQVGTKTSGVSTSTDKEIARYYATRRLTREGHVAVIDRDKLNALGILQFDVGLCAYVAKPLDKEIILYFEKPQDFPKEIILEIYPVKP